ncbi:MAG: helix-turn-helix transcriptional regulator [Oscillospiraceae bacterium]|nr:helix-turn-helix transcriptional regulator [Oscillospiraceae bacterium]
MLGENIKALRSAMGWSQVELAKRLNITKQTVSNWENENIQPSIEMLVHLSKTLGVTTDHLLGLDHIPRISVEGLSPKAIAHLTLLIDDLRDL